MLILSQSGKVLYDTSSGTSICIEITNVQNEYKIIGHNGETLAVYESLELAKSMLRDCCNRLIKNKCYEFKSQEEISL